MMSDSCSSGRLNDEWSDSQIWQHAKIENLTIITKDVDFSNRILTTDPPPKVIHMKIGNMKLSEFWHFMQKNWEEIERMSKGYNWLLCTEIQLLE